MLRVILFLILIAISERALVPASAFVETLKFKKPSANLQNVNFANCAQDKCVQIQSPSVSEGFIVRGLSFGRSKLVFSDSYSPKRTLTANNVFFDYDSNRLFIEGLNGDSRQEGIYELGSGQFRKF